MDGLCYGRWVLFTKSDTVDIVDRTFDAVYVGTVGNIVVVNGDDSTSLFTGVPAGTVLPIGRFKRINSTSTTAGAFQLLYR